MSTSPHKSWKGCALCKPHKDRRQGRGSGWAARDPRAVIRMMGRTKYRRHDLPDGS